MKKAMPIIYLVGFIVGLFLILTADTGMIAGYHPALIAGGILSCFSGIFLANFLHAWHKKGQVILVVGTVMAVRELKEKQVIMWR